MHRLLTRQIRKATAEGRLDLDLLLAQVDAAYHEADRERVRVDRAISLMSEELLDLNRTARARAEQKFRTIIDNVLEGILISDAAGRILTVNQPALRMLGDDAGERWIGELMPCIAAGWSDGPTACGDIDVQSGSCRTVARRTDGGEFPVEASVSALQGDNGRRFVFVLRDVSERIRTERELQAAREEAEQASRLKSQFLASVCHELRTPLNAILGFSDAIRAGTLGPVEPPAYAGYVAAIHEGGLRLLALVDQILDLAKIEAGRMELAIEEFAVDRMLQAICRTTEMLARKNHNAFALTVEGELGTMRGDELRVSQVLLNLLGNACKFTHAGSVRLTVRRLDGDGGTTWLEFRVADTGIGIGPEQLGRLFKAFDQADATVAKRYGGSGLGLSIVRHLCRMMGGTLTIDSALGRGSIFTLRLPTASPPAAGCAPG